MRLVPCLAPALLLTSGAVATDLPRAISFANETADRLTMTVTEGSNNEKEVEVGDIDNDGDLDVVIAVGSSDFGERRNKLYRNDDGVFTEISSFIPEFSMSDVTRNAFLRDFDGDGWLDIYVINDSNSGGFAGSDHLYMAVVRDGELVGYSEEGLTRIASGGALGAACGGVSADFDQDGDIDVYSGNYPGPSQDVGLYNDGSGVLMNMTSSLIPADSDYTVDVATADMNGDGKLDLLVSNWGPNLLYYNDLEGAGSGVGDYRYPGSTQNLGDASLSENAMEPADFDNDGDMDFYWSGRAGAGGDRMMVNTGNDASDKAVFDMTDPIPNTVTGASRKASVADFNGDGRLDVFVANQTGGRPAILRNTTVDGTISFVDWTPASAISGFPNLQGWHAAVFDSNADGDVDILIGAFNGDHLIETTDATAADEDDLTGGVLPTLWNVDPVAVRGRANAGESDLYEVADAGSGFMSVVLNGPEDYRLEILAADGQTVLNTIDRGGAGVEEAVQVSTSGVRFVRVTALGDSGGAECVEPADLDGDCVVGLGDLLVLLAGWGCDACAEDFVNPGNGAGLEELLAILAAWGPVEPAESEYQLEVLGRS